MIPLPFIPRKNLIIVTSKQFYFTTMHFTNKELMVNTLKSYDSFEELFEKEALVNDTMVVLDNNSSFEEAVEIDTYLNDKTVIESALAVEMKKKSTIASDSVFHYLKVKNNLEKNRQLYKVFGIDSSSYKTLISNIENVGKVELVALAEHLFYNYCDAIIDRPFIALNRFNNQDILIVGDGSNLVFSRTHYADEEENETINRSIEYVMQRFKDYDFCIYLGGEFSHHSLRISLEERYNGDVHLLEKKSYPIYLNGLKKLPKNYNFIPKETSVKRWLGIIQERLLLVCLIIFSVSVISFFMSYSHYKGKLVEYQNIEKEYKAQLKALNLIGDDRLNQLSKIKNLSNQYTLRKFKRLLNGLEPIFTSMELSQFDWKSEKRRDSVKIVLKKHFNSLTTMDAFLLKFDKQLAVLEKKSPKTYIESDLDFKNLTLEIQVLSKKSRRNYSLTKKAYN